MLTPGSRFGGDALSQKAEKDDHRRYFLQSWPIGKPPYLRLARIFRGLVVTAGRHPSYDACGDGNKPFQINLHVHFLLESGQVAVPAKLRQPRSHTLSTCGTSTAS